MQNRSQNELEQIAKMRRIKNYKNKLREKLLIALLKSDQSHAELCRIKDNNAEIEETKKFFKQLRNRFSKEKMKKMRRKFRFRESISKYLKGLEKKSSLTDKKQYTKKLKIAEESLKKLK